MILCFERTKPLALNQKKLGRTFREKLKYVYVCVFDIYFTFKVLFCLYLKKNPQELSSEEHRLS